MPVSSHTEIRQRDRSKSPKMRYTQRTLTETKRTTVSRTGEAKHLRRDESHKPPLCVNTDGVRKQRDNAVMTVAEYCNMKNVWTDKKILCSLMIFRVISAIIVHTWYVPDEYWQSLEVAHKIVFGYGHLTWEWREGLRGTLYPGVIAVLYKVVDLLGLDSREVVILFPRIMQAMFSSVGDFYLMLLARRLFGCEASKWVIVSQLTSWFIFYAASRTLTNTAEMVLTTIALYYFPWPDKYLHKDNNLRNSWQSEVMYLSLAALACVVRPTAVITWVPLCLWHLRMGVVPLRTLMQKFLPVALVSLGTSTVIDRFFYGRWVFVHYNFLHFNFLTDLSSFYGAHSWHWYFTQGMLAVVPSHIIPAILGVMRTRKKALAWIIMWNISLLSLKAHKEFRFLLPILPLVSLYAGYLMKSLTKGRDGTTRKTSALILLVYLIVTNTPVALYTSLVHQQGTLNVMKHISESSIQSKQMSVLFLMPCHSTPYYSYVHKNIEMQFLTCEPNLEGAEGYVDEADTFYNIPLLWLGQHASPYKSVPTHVVMFDVLVPKIQVWLHKYRFNQCAQFFHTHFPEGRVGSEVVVFCRA